VHSAIAAQSPGTRLVKTHNCAGFVERYPLHEASVTAGAVYVVRDPRDVAVSMSHHFGLDVDAAIERLGDDRVATANDALFVTQVLGAWSHHVRSRAARLLKLDDDRARIERAVQHASFVKLSGQEQSEGFAEVSVKSAHFFRDGRAGQWRAALTPEQSARVLARHGAQMARFGYAAAR
jgi:hypothetical protein